MRWIHVGQLCNQSINFGKITKLLWFDCWVDRGSLLSVCWTASSSIHVEKVENLMSGVCVRGLGKGLVSPTAASGAAVWGGGESEEMCYFFLRIYCSVGMEHLSGSLRYRPGMYQLVEKLLQSTNVKIKKSCWKKRKSSLSEVNGTTSLSTSQEQDFFLELQ